MTQYVFITGGIVIVALIIAVIALAFSNSEKKFLIEFLKEERANLELTVKSLEDIINPPKVKPDDYSSVRALRALLQKNANAKKAAEGVSSQTSKKVTPSRSSSSSRRTSRSSSDRNSDGGFFSAGIFGSDSSSYGGGSHSSYGGGSFDGGGGSGSSDGGGGGGD